MFLSRDDSPRPYPMAIGAMPIRPGPGALREVSPGRVLANEVFLVLEGTPYFPESSWDGRERRVVVQVRSNVRTRLLRPDGGVQWEGTGIALAGFSDPPGLGLGPRG